jgi:putative acyl-CoA dehydrogenase
MVDQDGFNQSPFYGDVDLYAADQPLRDAVAANGAEDEAPLLAAFGRRWGSIDMMEQARLANENPPKLRAFDAKGFRRDIIEHHPAYHHFLKESIDFGLHASTWTDTGDRADPPAEVARAARCYMAAQVEPGHLTPVVLTRAAVAALAREPALTGEMIKKAVTNHYDPSFRPWEEKFGITLGIAMTERQGGSDVRTNVTRAEPSEDGYLITGHKWFISAPMSDAFLVLAQTDAGPTCFLVPRFRPDGSVNALHFVRLKDKLGNRANASVECEFNQALGWRIGTEGDGVGTMMGSVQLTRTDCAVSSAGLMRAALTQALHHARHRAAFGKRLVDQPLMRAVLADLALEMEATVALVMRLCRSIDQAGTDERERVRARILTPVAKFWVCKLAPTFIAEAMECMGGNGYIEDGPLPRLYREAPNNAIGEGSGNVLCLDVLHQAGQNRDEVLGVLGAIRDGAGNLSGAAAAAGDIEEILAKKDDAFDARIAVERLALLAGTEAMHSAKSPFSEAFARTRLAGPVRATYGSRALSPTEADQLISRVLPD